MWTGWSEMVIETKKNSFSLCFTILSKNNANEVDLSEKTQIDANDVLLIQSFFNTYTYTQDTSMITYSLTEEGDSITILKGRTDGEKRLYVFGEYYLENGLEKFNFRKPLTNRPDADLVELLFRICYKNLREQKIIDYIRELETELGIQ
jgi:hypothetical protein